MCIRDSYPVKGSIKVAGQPADGAIVFMHRKGKTDILETVPFATANAAGEFTIATPSQGDGAQVGEYEITLVYPDKSKPEGGNGERPDLLNGAYVKPGTGKFTYSVKEGPNTIPTLEITLAPAAVAAPDPNQK